jgi:hypothetical protein
VKVEVEMPKSWLALTVVAGAWMTLGTPVLAQSAGEDTGKKGPKEHTVITDKNRDQVHLTPEQQGVVDKLIRLPETVNIGVVNLGEKGPRDNEGYTRIHLPLADGKQVVLVRTQPTVKTEQGFTWRGQVEGSGERAVVMLWQDGHLSGYFGYQGRVYMISHAGGDIHTMAEIDPGKLPPDHPASTQDNVGTRALGGQPPAEPAVDAFPDSKRAALEAKQITIDLMLLYTKNAASHHIGDPADLLALGIEQANETFRNSGLGNIKLRLVHTEEVDYDETGGQLFTHLYQMVDGKGPFANVKKLRDEKRADIVGLVLHSPTACGLSVRVGAEAEEAFFAVHHACAGITYSIAHEVGHILGARHDRVMDVGDKPFAYGHGYINGTKWRDMMSYEESCGGCPRIPYWSNPRIKYQGEPTGTAASDNARVILEQAERVSNFR